MSHFILRLAQRLLLCATVLAHAAIAGEAEWQAHVDAGLAAAQRGDYDAAVASLTAALREAEAFGENDRRLWTTIGRVAEVHVRQGRYAEAETLYRRNLALVEKAPASRQQDLVTSLDDLALACRLQGRHEEAQLLQSRARSISHRTGGQQDAQAPPPIVRRGGTRSFDTPPPPRQVVALPEFPWPPPTPSAQLSLPNNLFHADKAPAPSLAAVGARLVGALEQAKYFEYSHYRVPNGFALVARLERVSTDGTPQPEEFRFLQPGTREPFSMSLYVKQLFFAPEGFYRQIIFVVTDQPFRATGAKIDAQAAAELLSGGANRLSEDYAKAPFTANHRVSALIYEFAKGAREGDVSTLTPGRLGARTHLDRAGIYPALGSRR